MTNSEGRDLCLRLFHETLHSLQVAPRLRNLMKVSTGNLLIGDDCFARKSLDSVRILSFGKAADEMANTSIEILHDVPVRAVVVSPHGIDGNASSEKQSSVEGKNVQRFEAGHPYPDEQSVRAADAAVQLLTGCTSRDLVLFLISGGGSALLERPLHNSVSLSDLRSFYEVLVTCGANIYEMNAIRKHLSRIKGGRLAKIVTPAQQVTIYVSDVPEAFPSAVASGPSMPDESTLEDCLRIVNQYGLLERFPASIRALFETGDIPETPKSTDACFAQSRYHCLLSNSTALEHLLALARSNGIAAEIDTSCDDWPVAKAASYLLDRVEVLRRMELGKPVLLISGGELSSPVSLGSTGIGGRNQAFVLECVRRIAGKSFVVLSAGTDGTDGNSPATGAIGDGDSARRASALGLDPVVFSRCDDSYRFFEMLGDAIITGPTGTNVRDLRLLLAYE